MCQYVADWLGIRKDTLQVTLNTNRVQVRVYVSINERRREIRRAIERRREDELWASAGRKYRVEAQRNLHNAYLDRAVIFSTCRSETCCDYAILIFTHSSGPRALSYPSFYLACRVFRDIAAIHRALILQRAIPNDSVPTNACILL